MPEYAGDGFLMRQGYTLVWSGWQGDLIDRGGTIVANLPLALQDGKPLQGRVRQEFNPMAEGILSAGVDVVDIGVTPTPVMYFSLFTLEGLDGGIQVTGSHNPPEFNGFKICVGKETIYGPKIKKLYELIVNEDFESGSGKTEKHDILPTYIKFLRENINVSRPLKVVLDCGNGVSALVAPSAFSQAGCAVESLWGECRQAAIGQHTHCFEHARVEAHGALRGSHRKVSEEIGTRARGTPGASLLRLTEAVLERERGRLFLAGETE